MFKKMVLLAVVLVLFFSGITQAKATDISGEISTNVTWNLSGSPYVVSGWTQIDPGVTLTIKPGVVVKFNSGSYMDIYGNLVAAGTAAARIYFTDILDDSVGGDTNGDGAATTPAPGGWYGLYLEDGATASITYSSLRYGGSFGGNIYKTGSGALTLSHSVLSESSSDGIHMDSATGNVAISNNTISGNQGNGISLCSGSTATFTGNIISGNSGYPFYVNDSAVPVITGNTISANGYNAIGLEGSITRDTIWYSRAIPYVVNGSVSVNSGYTLTIKPGAVVKFQSNSYLDVSGNLTAEGTALAQICFTDIQDDSVGGDTNGDGADSTPAPGGWYGLYLEDGANASITYSLLRYGGSFGGNIYKTGSGALALSHSVLSDSSSDGIHMDSATGNVAISTNTISGNQGNGISLYSGSTATFTGNIISGNSGYPFYVNDSAVPVITGNTISANSYNAIGLEGNISRDTTWNSREIPYVVNGVVYVNSGYTLTIKPGAVVKFQSNSYLDVGGNLIAEGTAADRIYFTDIRDDSVGGDTNGDGADSTPAPGGWYGLYLEDGANASVTYSLLRYGGNFGGNIYKTGSGDLALGHSIISESSSSGLYFDTSSGNVTVSTNTISDNQGNGISLSYGSTATITGNVISGNVGYPFYVNDSAVPVIAGNTIGANGYNAIGLGGSISRDTIWPVRAIPYGVEWALVIPGYTLTIAPGAVLKFLPDSYLVVDGNLIAEGTPTDIIHFTDMRDDSVGGDTNGDGAATTPVPGGWGGLDLEDGATGSITYISLRYGGGYYGGWRGNIYKYGSGDLTLSNSISNDSASNGLAVESSSGNVVVNTNTIENNQGNGIQLYSVSGGVSIIGNAIRHNGSAGIYLADSAANIYRDIIYANGYGIYSTRTSLPVIGGSPGNANDIYANTDFALYTDGTAGIINARYNFWGDPAGPATSGPNAISDSVDAGNFLTAGGWGRPFTTNGPDRIGNYDDGSWYLDANNNGTWEPGTDFYGFFGTADMTPVTGDWNGDGHTKFGAYVNGIWFLDMNGNGFWDGEPTDLVIPNFGYPGVIPVTGDWNGDGITKIGVYDPNTSVWFLDMNGNGFWDGEPTDLVVPNFGFAGCLPVVGDWNGDGHDKIGVYYQGEWFLDTNGNYGWDGSPTDSVVPNFGYAGGLPVVGDWTGSGVDRIGVFDNGNWFLDIDNNRAWDPAIDKYKGSFGITGMIPMIGHW